MQQKYITFFLLFYTCITLGKQFICLTPSGSASAGTACGRHTVCLHSFDSQKNFIALEYRLAALYRKKQKTCQKSEKIIAQLEKKYQINRYYNQGKPLPKHLQKKEKTWSKMLNGCETHRLKILTKWLPPNADEPN